MGWVVIAIAIAGLVAGGFWFNAKGETEQTGDPMRAIILLESEPRVAAIEHVRSALIRLGIQATSVSEPAIGAVKIELENGELGVISAARPYLPESQQTDRLIQGLEGEALQDAINNQTAFISIWVHDKTPRANRAALYPSVAKLASELVDAGTLAIWETATGEVKLATQTTVDNLRSGIQSTPIQEPPPIPLPITNEKSGLNSESQAIDAQARWPDFVNSFRSAASPEGFIVRANLKLPNQVEAEQVWIEVKSCDMLSASGELLNSPSASANLSKGDSFRVSIHDICDWETPNGK